jgi:anti-sigma-K factor RskA
MVVEEHVIEQIPAYAMNCLDQAEADRVEDHLVICSTCRAELKSYQEIVGDLAFTAPMVEPPARLKQALMDRVQADVASSEAFREDSASVWQRLLGMIRRISPFWSLASLVLVVVLITSNVLLWSQVNRLNAAQPAGMQLINLKGAAAVPGASGLIVISTDGRHGTLVVDDLPPLDQSKQYQLWLIKDGQRTNGGVFSVSPDGYGSLWVSSPEPLAGYSSFGVTVEPAGGSPGPTGEKVLGGNS